jgi:hypothetical protein
MTCIRQASGLNVRIHTGDFYCFYGALKQANEIINLEKQGIDCRIFLEEYGLKVWLDSFSHRNKVESFMSLTLVM